MMAAMVVDCFWCAFARWRQGDPGGTHWSRLRNRNGSYVRAACRGVFLLPPADGSDEGGLVRCGDCGHGIAPYGEMRPHLHAEARRRFRIAWGRWRIGG